jgi:cytidylate kinase
LVARQGGKSRTGEIDLEFVYNPISKQSEIHLNGENVEYVIRDMVVAETVSEVAAIRDGGILLLISNVEWVLKRGL